MIRIAKYADAHQLVNLVEEAWKLTPYGHIEIDELMLRRAVHRYLTDKKCRVWVSVINGEIKGLLAVSLIQLEISKAQGATDHCFYCKSGEGKMLIKRYIKWAERHGAQLIGMCVSSGNKRANKLIESSGFALAGGNFYYE